MSTNESTFDPDATPGPEHARRHSLDIVRAIVRLLTASGLPWTRLRVLLGLSGCVLMSACGEDKIPVEVTGYNHMSDESIIGFTVNGASGPNMAPQSGGTSFNCCVKIPKDWQPGMKARVTWAYGSGPPGSRPAPPPQEAEVEVPKYSRESFGTVQVHFYANHRVKLLVSRFGIESPCSVFPEADKAPWETRKDLTAYYTRGKGKSEACEGLRASRRAP
ncbi:DUF3304 domain-containing protein [Variovorax sp. 38R]|uniref:DUF3304 domain-containing protein n=1 Tax=Variovorax sp. 38R TaxID=2774875 RepID=UPI001783EBBD|nr:DUF3304 domain-containing protein [Variovorax sp. 38R]QOF79898.1 DUF3304 domain-containing protein [Variovorax sp. 38R]